MTIQDNRVLLGGSQPSHHRCSSLGSSSQGPERGDLAQVSSAHLSVPDVGGQHLVFLILWEEEGTGLAQGDPPTWWWSSESSGLTTLRMAYTITSMATVVVVRQSRTGRVLFL